jgi:hypothetical protein
MTIQEIADDLNSNAERFEIGLLQTIRKQLKNLDRLPARKIFGAQTIDTEWAFHIGGRSELQFNIGKETIEGIQCLRFGVAFSLEPSQTLPDVSLLFPKIKRFNEFMALYPDEFTDFYSWHWAQVRSPITTEKIIHPSLAKKGIFTFFGKYVEQEQYSPDIVLRTFDQLIPLYKYVEGSENVEPLQTTNNASFSFQPNTFQRIASTSFTQAQKQIDVNLRHNAIQAALITRLSTQFGKQNISSESSSGISNKIDVILKNGSEYWFYEVKTGGTARACIREALGQLLEYSYWPGAQRASKLIVAGEPRLDEDAASYIASIRDIFSLPITYEQQSVENI